MIEKLFQRIKKWGWDDAEYPPKVFLPYGLLLLTFLGLVITVVIKFWNVIIDKVF